MESMQMRFYIAFLLMVMSSVAVADSLCPGSGNLSLLSSELEMQVENLNAIVQASTKKEKLSKITIRHGAFGVGIGGGEFFAKSSEGKLVSLNIDVTVGLFGVTENIKESISLDKLIKGEKLKFQMEGGSRDVLVVEPQSGFSALGGIVKFKIWNGENYSSESMSIKKINGVFVAQKGGSKVVDLDIHMRGLSIANMYVGDYTISTK
jgi:hypothetical protein